MSIQHNSSRSGDSVSIDGRIMVMKFIHLALFGGVAMFGLVIFLISRSRMNLSPDFQNPILLVSAAMLASSCVLSAILHKFYFNVVPMPTDELIALSRYQAFFLIRAAIVEGSILFAGVVTLLLHNIITACLYVLGAAILAFFMPSRREFERLMNDYKPLPPGLAR